MKLYYHPLSGYSMKVLLALYEKDIPFESEIVQLMDPEVKKKYQEFYPIGKVPLLELKDGHMIPESSIIVEWIDQNHGTDFIPRDPEQGRKARFYDRMNDLYISNQVGTIFFDSMKPEEHRNAEAVQKAKHTISSCFENFDQHLSNREWFVDSFSIADLSAFPGLFWAQKVYPFSDYKHIQSYFNRLMERPATQKLMKEVTPALKEWGQS